MSPHIRRLIYVCAYELIAVLIVTGALLLLGHDLSDSGLTAIVSSVIALVWNYLWTTMFEAWEARQISTTRTVLRRIAHAVGFEGGLILFLVPVMAWLLGISLLEAFLLDLGILVFFLCYTFVFAWLFDLILPRRPASQVH